MRCCTAAGRIVGLNSVWLLAFGTPLARRIRRGCDSFGLMGVCAMVGALTHWALFPFGAEPLVGASAAVSGCMGAALRFAFHVRTAVLAPDDVRDRLPSGTFRERRALSFLVAWFVSNALFGIGSVSFGLSDQPVAWQAHIGGFLTGLLLFRWFDPAPGTPNRGTARHRLTSSDLARRAQCAKLVGFRTKISPYETGVPDGRNT